MAIYLALSKPLTVPAFTSTTAQVLLPVNAFYEYADSGGGTFDTFVDFDLIENGTIVTSGSFSAPNGPLPSDWYIIRTGLTPNTKYTYQILIDGVHTSNTLSSSCTITTDITPTLGALSVTYVGATIATLTHPAAAHGTPNYSFQWYRNTGSSSFTPGPSNILTGKTGPTLNDTGLSVSTNYSYICVVTDSVGATAQSPLATLRTNAAVAIATPTSVSVGANVSNLLCTSATGGSSPITYQWYRSTSGSTFTPGPSNIISGATSLSLSDEGLTPSTNYWYKIVATDYAGATATSSALAITTDSALTIATPTLSSKTATTANLSTTGASGGSGGYTYQWFRSTISGFSPSNANVVVGQTNTTINDTGLIPVTTYYYICQVTDSAGDVTNSSQVAVQTNSPPLSLGTLTVDSVGQTAVTITAPNATGGAPAYTYAWSRSTVQGQTGSSLGLTTQTITDTGLTPDTEYFYTCTVTDSASPTPGTASSPQIGVTTTAVSNLGDYYAGLLILQYLGQPKAYSTIKSLADIATLSGSSTQTADNILPLIVQNAFNINTATGTQLDVLGKYVGVSRSTSNLNGQPITLSDEDFQSLIKIAIAQNNSGSNLSSIVNFLYLFFPGEVYVTDNQNFSLSYIINSTVGSQNLIDAIINENLLPRPMGVMISSIVVNSSLNFFGFSSYGPGGTWIPAAPLVQGFQDYSSYNNNSPWMTYQMAVETGI